VNSLVKEDFTARYPVEPGKYRSQESVAAPENRYASAGQFAEDLNRFLSDQPLKFAPELSVWEQIRKWVRRHPRLTSTGVVSMLSAAVIIPCVMLLGIVVLRACRNADTARRAQDFEAGTLQARPMVSNSIPNEDTLREGVLKCRKTLEIYEVLDNPNWQKGPHWTGLSHAQRSTLAEKVARVVAGVGPCGVASCTRSPGGSEERPEDPDDRRRHSGFACFEGAIPGTGSLLDALKRTQKP